MNNNLPTFTTPVFTITIPSTGKKVQLRSLLAKELKTFIILKENNDSKEIINSILECIKVCGPDIPVDKLKSYDLEYIYIQLYVNSTAEKSLRIKYKCNKVLEGKKECGNQLGLLVPLNDIKVDVKKKDFILEKISSTNQKVALTFTHPNVSSMINVDENFDLISACLSSLTIGDTIYHAGTDFGPEYAKEIVDSFTLDELKAVSDFFDEIPTVKYKTEVKCSKCGTVHKVDLRGMTDFFQ